jgi:hypothetical protein
VELHPRHKRAFLLRCEALSKLKRWDEAIDDANVAIGLGHREGHRTRGAVHLERGAFREAVADLNVAVRIEPSDKRAWSLRSSAHAGLGNAERAAEDAAEAARVDPDTEAGLCVVCIDEPRATRLNPCEHSALCADCARECQTHHGTCPICNAPIKAIEYGTFMRTFAPADADLNFDRLASAIKKAREDNPGATAAQMATLNPIGEGETLGGEDDDEDAVAAGMRPSTPERDFSGYVVGDAMDDETAERSAPTTPVTLAGGFGGAGGLEGLASPTPMGGRPRAAADSEDEEDDSDDESDEERDASAGASAGAGAGARGNGNGGNGDGGRNGDGGDGDGPDTPPR